MLWQAGWTYVQDRGYVCFKRLAQMLACGAHFVVRLKQGIHWSIVERHPVPSGLQVGGIRLLSDWTVRLWGWPEPLLRIVSYRLPDGRVVRVLTDRFDLVALSIARLYKERWKIAVSREGPITQSVQVRPRLTDSGLVAREAPGRESQPVKPSDNPLCKERAQRSRLQRTVNADVASLHATPVAETVDNARRQQGPGEKSLQRRSSPAGYQRRQGAKGDRATGEVLGARRRKLAAETWPITVSGKWSGWHQDGGSGCSTVDPRAAKPVGREGPGPVGIPYDKGRQG